MHTTEILPEIAVVDAILLFRRFGVDVIGMGPDAVKAARRDLLHKHHPDRGGDLDTAQSINAAYDLLRNGVPKYRRNAANLKSYRGAQQRRREQLAVLKLCYPDHPDWAWAGCAGEPPTRPIIDAQDFTDPNFIKKAMWELSGHSDGEYTVWGFDGRFFRKHVAVFGAPKVFNYMADAMLTWQTKGSHPHDCRAVFAHEDETGDFYLIYADGKYYGESPLRVHRYFDKTNPQNDREFERALPELLDKLRTG